MNESNLIPQAHRLTVEEQSRGGRASGEARRKLKKLREYLEIALDKGTDFEGEAMNNAEAITVALINKAKSGDVRAYQTIRDGLGEKPAERIEAVPEISEEARREVEAALFGFAESEGEDE